MFCLCLKLARAQAVLVMLSVEQQLVLAGPRCELLAQKYLSADGQLVCLRDEVYKVCEEFGLMTRPVKHCASVGFHPKNRGENGITPQHVSQKVSLFCHTGFSPFECERACLVGRAPGMRGDDYEAANARAADSAAGQLATVTKGSLDSFSITCNHTFQSFRAIHFGAAMDDASISLNGKISSGMVAEKCPLLASTVADGLRVRMLPWQFEERWPSLIELIIEADNVPLATAMPDTTLDLMHKVHKLSQTQTKDGKADWDLVEKMMLRSEIRRPHDIPHLVAWVRSSSGGKNPFVLLDVLRFAKGLLIAREIPSVVLGSFEKVYLGPSGAPYWRGAVVKAMLSARLKDFVNGINMYVTVQDVAAWGKVSLKIVQAANDIMELARAITIEKVVQKLGADSIAVAMDTLDIRLCAHIQKRPLRGEFKSLLEIAGHFGNDLRTACKDANIKWISEPPEDWILPTVEAAVDNARVSKVTELCKGKLTESQLADHFKTSNIEVGKHAKEKGTNRILVVEEIKHPFVELREVCRKRKERFGMSDFVAQFEAAAFTKPEDSDYDVYKRRMYTN